MLSQVLERNPPIVSCRGQTHINFTLREPHPASRMNNRWVYICLIRQNTPTLPLQAGNLFLRSLSAVLGTALVAVRDGLSVESAAHDMVTHTGQVAHTSASYEYDGVLL